MNGLTTIIVEATIVEVEEAVAAPCIASNSKGTARPPQGGWGMSSHYTASHSLTLRVRLDDRPTGERDRRRGRPARRDRPGTGRAGQQDPRRQRLRPRRRARGGDRARLRPAGRG